MLFAQVPTSSLRSICTQLVTICKVSSIATGVEGRGALLEEGHWFWGSLLAPSPRHERG